MRVGHFEIRAALRFEIWDGSTRKYTLESFDEALSLADDLLEEEKMAIITLFTKDIASVQTYLALLEFDALRQQWLQKQLM